MNARPGRRAAVVIAAGGAAAMLAACGSSGGGQAAAGSGGGGVAMKSGSGSGLGMRNTSLGQVLTSGGRTVYLLTSDRPGHQSCTGSCFSFWPPVKMSGGPPSAVSGVSARFGVAHGQLTVDGHPAYTYAGDQSAGQVNGEGVKSFGGQWWAISSKGSAITSSSGGGSAPANSGGSSGSGSSGGYSY